MFVRLVDARQWKVSPLTGIKCLTPADKNYLPDSLGPQLCASYFLTYLEYGCVPIP
jgi:hypothetical protein